MPDPAPPIVVVPKKRGWGCFGCGCAIVVVIALLLLGLTVFGGKKLYQTALGYTGTAPVAIPTVDGGPEVYAQVSDKVGSFEQNFEREQPATLHLSAEEINTLIARDPNWAKARGHVTVQMQGQTATVQSSVLLGDLEQQFVAQKQLMAGRYLNADATFGLSFDPGTQRLLFDVQSLSLNGQGLPSSSTAGLDQTINQLVNQQLQANQLARDFLARVQKVDIENGELVIETK